MKAVAAIASGPEALAVVASLLDQLSPLQGGAAIDLALLFASDAFASDYEDVLAAVRERTGARVVIGCSGQGIIGPERELEGEPAMALQLFSLPGALLTPFHVDEALIANEKPLDVWRLRLGALDPADARALFLFADPFSLHAEQLLACFSSIREDLPLVGGLASARQARRKTYLFLDGDVFEGGAVGLALAGPYRVRTVVSQGAEPIGETWTITSAEANTIESIGMRPALDVLSETFRSLSPELQERARTNLLVGLAMNEYRDEFGRGDFLIRNLIGADQETGSIAIAALPRVGQTIQFQIRDPEAADEDLRQLLRQVKQETEGESIVGALLCSCNGRGVGLFGAPDHDARALSEALGKLPVAGFFCNGEIGPVGGKNFLHGFTASIALIIEAGPDSA